MGDLYYNRSNKIIGIGSVSFLPGDIKLMPNGYEDHPIVKSYEERKLLIPANRSKKAKAILAQKKVDEEVE
jgi:hypothetical protein